MNKKTLPFWIFLTTMIIILSTAFTGSKVYADGEPPTDTFTPTNTTVPTNTNTPLNTSVPTNTSIPSATFTPSFTPTETPVVFPRPLVVVDSYSGSRSKVASGKSFDVSLNLSNHGSVGASNVVVTFTSGDFIARGTGGVRAIGSMNSGDAININQELTAASTVVGKSVAYITATITYTDGSGTSYSSDATLAFNISATATPEDSGGTSPSATPTSSKRPQLVISSYQSDVNPLQPGTTFKLSLEIQNVGSTLAKNITMVMGGGSVSNTGSDSGTQVPGGVAGAGGEFTNFAPIGASNIQSLGSLSAHDKIAANQQLIVNVSTNPGTYPVKFSYIYTGDDGRQFQDDQVITLLVYRLPLVEVNFYKAVDPLTVGMPGILPIQIVNLSRSSTILGNMAASTGAGTLTNNSMLVGTMDPGGYFPMDVSFIPTTAGPAEILITLQYTDDFNQPRQHEFKLSVNIDPAPEISTTPGADGSTGPDQPVQPETFWQKVVRFVKGIFGLNSGQPTPTNTVPEINPNNGGGGGGGSGGGGGKGFLPSIRSLS
jgi:hypothetical protein